MNESSLEEKVLIETQPLPEIIYSWLRERILNGGLAPGAVLRQESLAKRFGVSRVPIREAMSRLQAEGLITLRPRRGFAVTSLNRSEIVEIFELRMVVEEHAVSVATRLRDAADVVEVGAILAEMETLDPKSATYLSTWAAANRNFHARLVSSARRQRLTDTVLNLSDAVEPYIRIESHFTGEVHDAEHEHRAIFEAFKAGDVETAGRLSHEHCASTMKRLTARIGVGGEAVEKLRVVD
jgi:DNA-binding GntR family transcriptional regulator